MYFRLKLVGQIMFAFALMIVGRLVWLQVFQHDFYWKKGSQHYRKVVVEQGLRGIIYDRRGEELAVSSPISHLIVEPPTFFQGFEHRFKIAKSKCPQEGQTNKQSSSEFCKALLTLGEAQLFQQFMLERIAPLARSLDETPEYFLAQIQDLHNQKKRVFYYRKNVQPEIMNEIFKHRVSGVFRENGYIRFYPTIDLMARVLGRVGGDRGEGLSGLEAHFNSVLKAESGVTKYMRTNDGEVIEILPDSKPAIDGQPIYLSLDRRIQFITHEVLNEALREFQAKGAHAIVADIQTGEVLAMVSLPSANPNVSIDGTKYSTEEAHLIDVNPIVRQVFEPGSVIKPIFIASALDEKIINPRTVFRTAGEMKIKGGVVRDIKNYGPLNTSDVISKSSNVGMALIAQHYPREKFYPFMQKMGFGEKVLNIEGEETGLLRNPVKLKVKEGFRAANPFEFANMTYGYGISATLAQIAQAYAIIGNNGLKVPLTVLKQNGVPKRVQRVISEQSAQAVQKMLREAVSEKGTGSKANTESYSVAGKTGTSHKVLENKKGYDNERYMSLFAGFAPAQNPRIVIVVMIDEPNKRLGHFGGVVSAPQFSKITDHSLKILGLLPDKIQFSHQIQIETEQNQ